MNTKKNRLKLKDSKTGEIFNIFNEDISYLSMKEEADKNGSFSLKVHRKNGNTVYMAFSKVEERNEAFNALDFYMYMQNEPIPKLQQAADAQMRRKHRMK